MGILYEISRETHAPSTATDSITINVPSGRMLVVHVAEITGMATVASAGAISGLYKSSGGGSGGSTAGITIQRVDANADGQALPTGFSVIHSYTTEPTLSGEPRLELHYQPYGGKDRSVGLPGAGWEFWSSSTYQVSIRGISSTANCACKLLVELF